MRNLIGKSLIYSGFLLLLIFISCSRKIFIHNNIGILGHGGMGIKSYYPLDSYQSLHKAYTHYEGTEGDVQITKDTILIFWHNSTTPHSSKYIPELNYAKIKKYKYLLKKYNICKVDSFLNLHKNNKIISFDTKTHGCNDTCLHTLANTIYNLVEKHKTENAFFVETNNPKLLNLLAKHKNYILFYYASNLDDALSKLQKTNFEGVSIHYSLLNRNDVKLLHLKGLKVMMWGMKTRKQVKKAISKGADYYQTDAKITIIK